ncbi:MAG: 3'-5' exonuclease [Marinospirillum sp.]|uniref:3'-5' exonuclease n=1 Tax=Marinospirillum sp. TaxID=2183934 RepID=UPI001A021EBA|nr:3'-5' exonuclease [Marinospirillum sp.]MBE0506953.1 3'-5' exonuclease [Marinospirillum sp.]
MEPIAPNCVYLDLETTGLNRTSEDEAVEIAIVGAEGETLLHTRLRPKRLAVWPGAEAIHGISPADVQDCPTLDDVLDQVIDAVRGRQLVIYNSAFDLDFLPPAVVDATAGHCCCMEAFAQFYGEWDERHDDFRWKKLVFAADHVGHVWSGSAHSALADAQATRSVWQWLVRHGVF